MCEAAGDVRLEPGGGQHADVGQLRIRQQTEVRAALQHRTPLHAHLAASGARWGSTAAARNTRVTANKRRNRPGFPTSSTRGQ